MNILRQAMSGVAALVLGAAILVGAGAATAGATADDASVTVKGSVLDSACAFTKGLDKPISKACATSCARAGSTLVILTEDGTIYWPIADTTPSKGQNFRLLPFSGEKVTATGKVYDRGGSKAIVIDKVARLEQLLAK